MNLIIPFANEAPIAQDLGLERNPRRVICAANEARFDATHFSQALTTFAVGWHDPENLQGVLDALFPPVEVPRKFEYKSADNADAFLSESDDIRAIGAEFKRIAYSGSSVTQKTHNKGLTVVLDRDEIVAGSEERAVMSLIARSHRNDLRRGVALLAANCTNTGKTWNSSADPDQDIADDILTGADARGIVSNVVVWGPTAWNLRRKAYRGKTGDALVLEGSMTPQAVADALGIWRGMKVNARYQSGAAAKTRIVGGYVFMYYADPVGGVDDPSNAKHFWSPTESGRFRVYRQEFVKTVEITVEHYGTIAMPSTLGARMLTVS